MAPTLACAILSASSTTRRPEIAAHDSTDTRLAQAVDLLTSLIREHGADAGQPAPWTEPRLRRPILTGRVSATDRLSWWFRPATAGQDPWESFFDEDAPLDEHAPAVVATGMRAPREVDHEPLGRRAALRLLLAEPDDELIDSDADAVVTCLYDFVHALGRRDVVAAIDQCVAPDYHTLENDVEVDRDGLASQLRAELDRLRGWALDVSLIEIPEPIPHPDAILVYAELQIEARKADARQTIVHRRLAVFRQNRDGAWRIAALSPV